MNKTNLIRAGAFVADALKQIKPTEYPQIWDALLNAFELIEETIEEVANA